MEHRSSHKVIKVFIASTSRRGGTNTIAHIYSDNGKLLASSRGAGSNPYLSGLDTAADIIHSLFRDARSKLGDDFISAKIEALGLCMSGCGQEAMQIRLCEALRDRNKAQHVWSDSCPIHIMEDSKGSIFTSNPEGGAVLIAGTGSIGQLVSADGVDVRTGGWGHMLGDEAGAYWITAQAIQRVVWALDGFQAPGPCRGPADAAVACSTGTESDVWGLKDVDVAWEVLRRHLAPIIQRAKSSGGADEGVPDGEQTLDWRTVSTHDLVPIFYGDGFVKADIAGATKELARAAREQGDLFLKGIFREAGAMLGAMARTLAGKHFVEQRGSKAGAPAGAGSSRKSAVRLPVLSVTAVGSVFKSWDLLEEGFEAAATAPVKVKAGAGAAAASGAGDVWVQLTGARLVLPVVSSAAGAAYLGGKQAGVELPMDFDSFTEPLGNVGSARDDGKGAAAGSSDRGSAKEPSNRWGRWVVRCGAAVAGLAAIGFSLAKRV